MEVPFLPSLTASCLIFQLSHLSLTSVFTMLSLPINLHNLGYQVYPSLYDDAYIYPSLYDIFMMSLI